ncbi:ABC transporter permease subunit [Lichenibacterium ramalinae]|uniref:Ribose ABC transporter permease n=1 Tax=Lichenibacterium ramalinae TaxID=2316527 RepID=A0A4V1RJ08_9HYPH|nr:ribose ABC transporter permease [Lichenibacterium ramalinae]RYB06481.1 ribose ABC transporter permease [Lichenibacterium ramalinae]
MRSFMQTAGMLPVLVLLAILFQFLSAYGDTGSLHWEAGRFLTSANLPVVAQLASINAVLATGMTFVILTGGIDLSVGSILAVSAMSALIVATGVNYSVVTIPVGLLVGAGFGLVNGTLIAALKLPPFIVTLGSLTAVRGLARLFGNDTTVFNSDLSFAGIASNFSTPIGDISWLTVIALAVVALAWFILRRTVLGIHIYAVGGNPAAARLSGIKVWFILLFAYGTSGLLSGLAGLMQAAQLQSANGLQLGTGYELDAIAAVILGGTSFVGGVGSVIGTLIGALIIAVLANGLILAGVSDVWQYIIKGLVIIGAVALDRLRNQGGART